MAGYSRVIERIDVRVTPYYVAKLKVDEALEVGHQAEPDGPHHIAIVRTAIARRRAA